MSAIFLIAYALVRAIESNLLSSQASKLRHIDHGAGREKTGKH